MTVEAARVAGPLAAVGLALVAVAPWRGVRLAGLAAWVVGTAALALWLAPGGDAGLYAGVAAAGLAAAALLAVLFLRWPWLLPVALLASAPVSFRVTVAGASGRLLVPLYLCVAAAALALAWRIFWEEGRRELGPLAWPLALLVAWTGAALAWSDDPRRGATTLVLAVLPFGVIAVALARLRWRPGWVALLCAQLAMTAIVVAAVGLWQYATRDVRLEPAGQVGDLVVSRGWFFPVDAIFRDPTRYAHFLAVAVVVCAVVVLFGRSHAAWAALVAAAIAFAGLVPAFSQAAIVAVAAALGAALVVAWRRLAIVPVALAAVAVGAVALGLPDARHRVLGDDGASHAVDVRRQLASAGIDVAREHPLGGLGTGGYRRAAKSLEAAPVTVAAETGVPGLLLLASLVAAAFALPFLRRSPLDTTLGRTRAAVALALLAIVVHSLLADALLEDPLFWALLGLGAAAYRQAARA